MERSFDKDDQKQHGTLKQEDRKDRKHEGARETRPERPLPAEAKKEGQERDEHQPKVGKRDEEQGKQVPYAEGEKDPGQTKDLDQNDDLKADTSEDEANVDAADEKPSQGI